MARKGFYQRFQLRSSAPSSIKGPNKNNFNTGAPNMTAKPFGLGEPADAVNIPARMKAIKEHFAKNDVACVTGNIERSAAMSQVNADIQPRTCVLDDIISAGPLQPRLVVMEAVNPPANYEDTVAFHLPGLLDALNSNDLDMRTMHEKLAGQPIGLFVHLLCENVCVTFRQATLQLALLVRHELDEIEDDSYDWMEDDELDDELDLPSVRITELARQLAELPAFCLTRNREQRSLFAEQQLASEPEFDQMSPMDIQEVAERAKAMLDLEIIPARVTELAESGLPQKEIAAQVGCSLNKVKAILAANGR